MWKQKIVRLVNRRFVRTSALSVVSLGIGSGITYLVMNKKLETKYANLFDQEMEQAKTFYQITQNKPEPEEIANKYREDKEVDPIMGQALDALKEYQGKSTVTDEPHPEDIIVENIFDRDGDKIDWAAEKALRNTVDPYIISSEEFYQNENDYEQMSLTYYEGDDILSDGKDEPVQSVEHTVGLWAFNRFGHGSDDPNVVYIRNGRLSMDFEVMRNEGSFAEEVHGITGKSIRHMDSSKGKVRKFRTYDD